jgi:hypothetical protein
MRRKEENAANGAGIPATKIGDREFPITRKRTGTNDNGLKRSMT